MVENAAGASDPLCGVLRLIHISMMERTACFPFFALAKSWAERSRPCVIEVPLRLQRCRRGDTGRKEIFPALEMDKAAQFQLRLVRRLIGNGRCAGEKSQDVGGLSNDRIDTAFGLRESAVVAPVLLHEFELILDGRYIAFEQQSARL